MADFCILVWWALIVYILFGCGLERKIFQGGGADCPVKINGVCYPNCKDGYHSCGNTSTKCYKKSFCDPKQFEKNCTFCKKKIQNLTTNQPSYSMMQQNVCEMKHQQGCFIDAESKQFYPKCPDGYREVGSNCIPTCPVGMQDLGAMCVKDSYDRQPLPQE